MRGSKATSSGRTRIASTASSVIDAADGSSGSTRTRRTSVLPRGCERSRTSLRAAVLTPSGRPPHSSMRRETHPAGAPRRRLRLRRPCSPATTSRESPCRGLPQEWCQGAGLRDRSVVASGTVQNAGGPASARGVPHEATRRQRCAGVRPSGSARSSRVGWQACARHRSSCSPASSRSGAATSSGSGSASSATRRSASRACGLALYGVVPVLQERAQPFGRVYAAYGAVFVALSVLWGWGIDRHRPDARDWIGAAICIAGAVVVMWPRAGG